jgi:Holliday junction resolvasome RuvABC DNA-binding subunit
MNVQTMTTLAIKHWTKWLPKKAEQLAQEGMLEASAAQAAQAAMQEIRSLMKLGYREDEAQEKALPEFILLAPEADALLEEWERDELDELENQYQQQTSTEEALDVKYEQENPD